MPLESKLEFTVTGTFNELTEGLDEPDKIERLRYANRILFERLDDAYDHLKGLFNEQIKLVAGSDFNTSKIFGVAYELISNATDSVTEKFAQDENQYSADIKIRMSFDGDGFSLEVEDNGVGIAPNIEEVLYQGTLASPKRGHKQYHGKDGNGLTIYKEELSEMNGSFYHINKGLNEGAIFGYSLLISLQ